MCVRVYALTSLPACASVRLSVQEPNNLANKHAYKFSSVQRKTVGVRSSAGNKGIDFVTKRSKCE